MGDSKFYGLRGQRLALAVGIIAGVDFFLFGYDQASASSIPHRRQDKATRNDRKGLRKLDMNFLYV
jgi:hypothetical protein